MLSASSQRPLSEPVVRLASADDAMDITLLYQQIYQGNYPNPLMRDLSVLTAFLERQTDVWVVAEAGSTLVASVVYELDEAHRLARVFGAAVSPTYRGFSLLEKMMLFAQAYLVGQASQTEVFYATTRTSHQAAQIVAENLGFKKLGIFPNVHRTDHYETHCLTAFYSPDALTKRFSDFRIHPGLKRLFAIVQQECGLLSQEDATPDDLALDDFQETLPLELITAKGYALHRFKSQQDHGLLQAHFYPFHAPNMVVSSPCQTVELFIYTSGEDNYCTIIGVKKPRSYHFTRLLERTASLLREAGVRYIELIVRADKVKTIERVLAARFIPCAYFPAFQLSGGLRYDFAIFSRTFEILDFRHLQLSGINMAYLEEYLANMQQYFLKPQLTPAKAKLD